MAAAAMLCPFCGEEMPLHDRYGRIAPHQDGKEIGDIYKCLNEDSDHYGQCWYTVYPSEELIEGYPC